MKPILFFVFGIMLIANISCKKEIDRLPPATQTGANTFGCLIDGKAWVPTGSPGIFVNIYPTSGGFLIDTKGRLNVFLDAESGSDNMQIFLKYATTPGTYPLNKNTDPNLVYPESYGAYSINGQEDYVTDASHTGTVTITYADTVKGIVSGTFEMEVYQKSTGKIHQITNGRFDYKTHI